MTPHTDSLSAFPSAANFDLHSFQQPSILRRSQAKQNLKGLYPQANPFSLSFSSSSARPCVLRPSQLVSRTVVGRESCDDCTWVVNLELDTLLSLPKSRDADLHLDVSPSAAILASFPKQNGFAVSLGLALRIDLTASDEDQLGNVCSWTQGSLTYNSTHLAELQISSWAIHEAVETGLAQLVPSLMAHAASSASTAAFLGTPLVAPYNECLVAYEPRWKMEAQLFVKANHGDGFRWIAHSQGYVSVEGGALCVRSKKNRDSLLLQQFLIGQNGWQFVEDCNYYKTEEDLLYIDKGYTELEVRFNYVGGCADVWKAMQRTLSEDEDDTVPDDVSYPDLHSDVNDDNEEANDAIADDDSEGNVSSEYEEDSDMELEADKCDSSEDEATNHPAVAQANREEKKKRDEKMNRMTVRLKQLESLVVELTRSLSSNQESKAQLQLRLSEEQHTTKLLDEELAIEQRQALELQNEQEVMQTQHRQELDDAKVALLQLEEENSELEFDCAVKDKIVMELNRRERRTNRRLEELESALSAERQARSQAEQDLASLLDCEKLLLSGKVQPPGKETDAEAEAESNQENVRQVRSQSSGSGPKAKTFTDKLSVDRVTAAEMPKRGQTVWHKSGHRVDCARKARIGHRSFRVGGRAGVSQLKKDSAFDLCDLKAEVSSFSVSRDAISPPCPPRLISLTA